jgi:hypothetical protein
MEKMRRRHSVLDVLVINFIIHIIDYLVAPEIGTILLDTEKLDRTS